MFENFTCDKCDLYKSKKQFVLPAGNINAQILLVGEAPGAPEDAAGKPCMGATGALVSEALAYAGIDVSDVYVTNTVFCRPPNSRQPQKSELTACAEHLEQIIDNMPNLKIVIPMGAVALRATTKQSGITDKRGTLITDKKGRQYVPTYHPAAIIRNTNNKEVFLRDFAFAKAMLTQELKSGKYLLCDTIDKAKDALRYLQDKEYVAFDIETASLDGEDPSLAKDQIAGMSFTAETYLGYYIPFLSEMEEVWDVSSKNYIIGELKAKLEHPNTKLIMHNGKFDANFLKAKFGIDVLKFFTRPDGSFGTNFYFDTMLAHHILWQEPPHSLKHLARRFSDLAFYESELETYKNSFQPKLKNYGMIPKEVMYKYAAGDVDATYRLYELFDAELKNVGRWGLLMANSMPLVVPLCQAEYYGITMDRKATEDLGDILDNKIAKLKEEIYKLAGEKFNVNSGDQKAKILFGKLGLPKPRKTTKTGKIPTNKATLSQLDHPIAEKLIEHAAKSKLKSTYVTSLLNKLDSNNVIRTDYKIQGTGTGRLSSKSPNLQNIPAQKEFRSIFIARPGHVFVSSDFSQIELRVLAKFSNDPKLLSAYWNNEDIHDQVAHQVFNVPADEPVSKELRRTAKAINFGIAYCIQARSLSTQINSDEATAQAYIDTYLTKYSGVYEFQEYIKQFVKDNKYVKNLFGRVHHIPEIDHPDRYLRGEAERTAVNSPIQGTAGEITNACAVQIYLKFQQLGIDGKLVLTVHDELTYEVPDAQVMQAAQVIHDTMRSVAEGFLQLPVLVDQYINDRWLDWEYVSKATPALHQARFLQKRLGISFREFNDIPNRYQTALIKPKEVLS